MEQVLDRQNMLVALKRVKENDGAPGVDGVPTDRLADQVRADLGWIGYYALLDSRTPFETLEGWVRRRLRACLSKQWKRPRTRLGELRALGMPEWVAREWANSRKGTWRMAQVMNRALDPAYWRSRGLLSLTELTRRPVNPGEPPDADPHVRWCERTGASRPLLLDFKRGLPGGLVWYHPVGGPPPPRR